MKKVMSETDFDYMTDDAQGTVVEPMRIEDFDIEQYADYEASLSQDNRRFQSAKSGIAVYRRFRVPAVFSWACRDMELSLSLQLAALRESMKFKADIANFLEPWYGIGTIPAVFGPEYIWNPGQAPAVRHPYADISEVLNIDPIPIEQTPIGRQTLRMIEYFIEKTRGRIPMSLTDTQSPLNAASFLIEPNAFYTAVFDDPEGLKTLLDRIADLLVAFTQKQMELIGDALVSPGHGFAGSRHFTGFGMSDDVSANLSPDQILEFDRPFTCKAAEPFGGLAFHSCGDWSSKAEAVKTFPGLVMVDGAFTPQTDPAFNPARVFRDSFCDSGITVNARMVGGEDTVKKTIRELWCPGMKLIAVTYCNTPCEQDNVYRYIHEFCDA